MSIVAPYQESRSTHQRSRMSSFSSLLVNFREESWTSALRNCRRKVLRKKQNGKVEGVIPVKGDITPASEDTSSSLIIEAPSKTDEAFTSEEILSHRALRIVEKGTYALDDALPIPEFQGEEEVMIRNYATGLNPIDWKSVDYNFCLPEFPWVTGREMAGIVHKVAPGVTKFKVGDRVWTSTYYRDVRAGCFQDLVIVPQHTVLPIPDGMGFETAACLGVPALTAAMTLWKWLQVPRVVRSPPEDIPDEQKERLLIWGGSTVTGQYAIQIAVQSGLEVIAVTSSKTQALAERLGAHTVVVRDEKHNQEIVEQVLAVGGNRITRALDLVGTTTASFSLQCLSKDKPCLFAPLAMMKTQDVPANVEVLNVEMKQFVLDKTSTSYAEDLNYLLEHGRLQLPELTVLSGGLSAVVDGLERLKKGDMGGKKMVVSFTR
ncbi:zinc-binding dehydrogenase [Phlyctema vagabunda]|uniref:Zinc-binding dehydrogenase n=1 Tax=Phlyctema vagabunda TaxID=108571 RepID=A0ABR4PPN0_9HELO